MESDPARRLYLDLMKRAVTNFLYLGGKRRFHQYNGLSRYDEQRNEWEVDPISRPHTLLDTAQLDLLEQSVVALERDEVRGDFIEAGVWRGGAIMYLRALLAAYDIPDRQVIAADSFAGIPLNTTFRHDPVDDWQDRWAASLGDVRKAVRRYGLLDDRIEFVAGYFADTLKTLSDRRFALIRLDSDSHDSVMTSLEWLYPLLSPGGIVIIDDWHLTGCRFAVNTYRERHGIDDEVLVQAENGYWIKRQAYLSPALPAAPSPPEAINPTI